MLDMSFLSNLTLVFFYNYTLGENGHLTSYTQIFINSL